MEISATVEQTSGGIIGIYRGYWDGVNPLIYIYFFHGSLRQIHGGIEATIPGVSYQPERSYNRVI